MVINGQMERQLSLKLPLECRRPESPEPPKIGIPAANAPLLQMECSEFLLLKANSAFNSFLSLLKKAMPEGSDYFKGELCRALSAKIEGERAILEKTPSPAQVKEANSLLFCLRFPSRVSRKSVGEESRRWKAISKEEQAIKYALERFSAICLLSGLHSLLEKGEYRDFLHVLDLCEANAVKCAREPREPGRPRVSGYEVLICRELHAAVSGKVKQLAEMAEAGLQ
ncbi:MAG: hypothetical protein QXH30_02785 [Candidatus Bilamarchaeaceae archaeon]